MRVSVVNDWFEHRIWRPGDTDAEVGQRLGLLVDALAVDYYAYAMIAPPHDSAVDIRSSLPAGIPRKWLASYPQEWIDRYLRRRFFLVDPVPDLAAKSVRPFFWARGAFLRAFRKRQRQVYYDSCAFGIVNGLAIPMRCAGGSVGVFSVAASDPKRLREATRHEHERLFAAAHDVHDFALDCVAAPREKDSGPSLSVREREILLWTIEGRTAEEIATMLCLSVFTVNRHASNAAGKLGCRNKHHAAVRALRTGLI